MHITFLLDISSVIFILLLWDYSPTFLIGLCWLCWLTFCQRLTFRCALYICIIQPRGDIFTYCIFFSDLCLSPSLFASSRAPITYERKCWLFRMGLWGSLHCFPLSCSLSFELPAFYWPITKFAVYSII